MGTDKRDRQKANRAARLEEERAAAAKAKRRQQLRTIVVAGVAIVTVMLLVSLLSSCSTDSSEGAGDATSTTAAEDEFTGDGTAPDAAGEPVAVDYGTGECPPAEGVDEPVLDFAAAPQQCIDPAKRYTATFETSLGRVVVELDTERTPITTNNFVALARSGYYDGTDIHRVVASVGFVQGGSPKTQDAADPGPGYTIPDEGGPYTAEDYVPGILAMARTAAPNSAGGQFFFLSDPAGTDALASAGTYAVFGRTTEGLEVLQQMAQLEVPGTESPSEPIVLESVTITES
jgi:cyclophilin family peptidyl-prolyl cis-trans isomerase